MTLEDATLIVILVLIATDPKPFMSREAIEAKYDVDAIVEHSYSFSPDTGYEIAVTTEAFMEIAEDAKK